MRLPALRLLGLAGGRAAVRGRGHDALGDGFELTFWLKIASCDEGKMHDLGRYFGNASSCAHAELAEIQPGCLGVDQTACAGWYVQ